MASIAKKLRRPVRNVEIALGRPIFTRPTDDDDGDAAEPPFVVVFGRRPDTTQLVVLGLGSLAAPLLVLPDSDVVDLLADGATATTVGIAWVQDGDPHLEQRTVLEAGMRVGSDGKPDPGMWAIELAQPSTAPIPSALPPGASPASAWCFLFPWVSFCQSK